MNLLAQEKLIWTVPAPTWARKIVRQLGAMTGEKRQAEREQLIASLPLLVQYGLTFTSATMREEGERGVLLREVSAWFEQEYGLPLHKFVVWYLDKFIKEGESLIEYPAGEEMDREEASKIYLISMDIGHWATVMACLRKVETRQVSMIDDNDEPEWIETDIPPEWKRFHTFLDHFPRPLFNQAYKLADDLNPGVWTTQMDDDAKNFGGVSVHR